MREKILAFLLALSIFCFGCKIEFSEILKANAEEWDIINIQDFGADPSGVNDSTQAVRGALNFIKNEGGEKTLYFPKGEYHFWQDHANVRELYISNTAGQNQQYKNKNIGILAEDMQNLALDGGGSKFVYHGDIMAFAAIRCENVSFSNFEFDYASPVVVDLTVEQQESNYVIVNVPSCYNYSINGNTIAWKGETSPVTGQPYWTGNNGLGYCQILDTNTGACWRDTSNPLMSGLASVQDMGNNKIKFTYTGTVPASVKAGYSFQYRNTARTVSAAFIWESKDTVIKDINARFLHGFGIVGQLSENITIDRVNFVPDTETQRTTASFADFIQMSSIKGKVSIKNCEFTAPHDDPINIHGTYLSVDSVDEGTNTYTVKYKHNETAGFPQFYVGDEVEFVKKSTMLAVENSIARVVSVEGPLNGSLDTIKITLDKVIPGVTGGDLYDVENITYTPEVEITGNRFYSIPTRGVLVTTRRPILIENNHFDNINMSGIMISCDAHQWYESGSVRDVIIRNNVFDRINDNAIYFCPTNQATETNRYVHENILIEKNTFNLTGKRVIDAKSVDRLVFRENNINRYYRNVQMNLSVSKNTLAQGEKLSLSLNTSGNTYTTSLFTFNACGDILLQDNAYDYGFNMRVDTSNTAAPQIVSDGLLVNSNNQKGAVGQIFYEVENPDVAAVDSNGRITALSPGKTDIYCYTVFDGQRLESNTVTITVEADYSGVKYLSDMDWVSASTGDASKNGGLPAKDKGWEYDTMRLTGADGNPVSYAKGVGTHANSRIEYNIEDMGYTRFIADIGVDYLKNSSSEPHIVFKVTADSTVLYTSPVMYGNTPFIPLNLDIKGAKKLILEVSQTSNVWSAHGNWADARLEFDSVCVIDADKSRNEFLGVLSEEGKIDYVDGYDKKVLTGYMTVPDEERLDNALSGRNPFTLEMYVKPLNGGNTNNKTLMGKGNYQATLRCAAGETGNIDFYVYDGAWHSNQFTQPSGWLNNWHHLAATYDGTVLKVYCDGVLLPRSNGQNNSTAGIKESDDDFGINYYKDVNKSTGAETEHIGNNLVSTARVYTKALTEAEINAQRDAILSDGESLLKPDNSTVLMWMDFNDAELNNIAGINQDRYIGNRREALQAEGLIDDVGLILTYEQKSDVEKARTAYDGLTPEQKTQVKNLQVLTQAESKIDSLYGAIAYVKDFGKYNLNAPSTAFHPLDVRAVNSSSTFKIDRDVSSPTGYSIKDGYFAVPDTSLMNSTFSGRNPFTMEVWVNPSDIAANNGFMMKNNNQTIKIDNSGRLEFCIQNGAWKTVILDTGNASDFGWVANQWQHIVGTYDGQYMNFYLNGRLIGTTDAGTGNMTVDSSRALGVGRYYDPANNAIKLRGRLAAARTYTKALSAAEVTARYETDFYGRIFTAAAEPVGAKDDSVLFWYDMKDSYAVRTTEVNITSLPDKTEYITGELFDPAGMAVTREYVTGIPGADEFTKQIAAGEYTVTIDGEAADKPLAYKEGTTSREVIVKHTESGETLSFFITVIAGSSGEEWTVTIPAGPKTVLLTPDNAGRTQDIGLISCSRPNIAGYESKTVSVSVSTLNGKKLTLKEESGYIPGCYAEYLLNKSAWSFPSSLYNTVTSVSENIELTVTGTDNIGYAGTYSDILTFTVAYN